MDNSKSSPFSKNFFLLSFLPAIAYWYLEENYPIRIAVSGGILLATLEVSLEKYFLKHVHTLSKFNFYLIAILGGISLLGDEGIWFKLQPAFTGIGIGGFLMYRIYRGKGLMQEMLLGLNQNPPPDFIIKTIELHSSFLFAFYGIFMFYVAFNMGTDKWLFYKTIGFYIASGIFLIFEFFWLRIKIKKYSSENKTT